MNTNKRCIVNFFSEGRENYQYGSERLVETIRQVAKCKVDIIIFSPDFTLDQVQEFEFGTLFIKKGYPKSKLLGECPSHYEQPYLFKAFGIQVAKEMGYEQILWCDSSVLLLKDPEPYFELSKELGVITFDNQGCIEATFTSDDCLEQLGCSVEYARTFFQISAGILLFNFNVKKAVDLFDEYLKFGLDGICLRGVSGSTREDFRAHRHDQSILSYLIRKYDISPINYGGWCYGQDYLKYKATFAVVGM